MWKKVCGKRTKEERGKGKTSAIVFSFFLRPQPRHLPPTTKTKTETGLPQVLGHDPRLRDRRQDLLHRGHHGDEAAAKARLRRSDGSARDDDGALGVLGVGRAGPDLEKIHALGRSGTVLRVRSAFAVGGPVGRRRGAFEVFRF
jgi:hypothetical protein